MHLDIKEMHAIKLSIMTAEETWSEVAAGFDNMQEQLNETVQQYKFFNDRGYGRSRVTGMQPVWTLTGRRVFGDAAQDFMFANKYGFGAARETQAKIEYEEAGKTVVIEFDCTFANLQEFSGQTEENSAISVEIHCDGKPEVSKN